jgi:hypothetical protein
MAYGIILKQLEVDKITWGSFVFRNFFLALSVLRPLAAIVLWHFSGNFTRVLIHAIKN